MKFAMAKSAAPLLNRPDFSEVFKSPLELDSQGRLMAVELIALPGMGLIVLDEVGPTVCRVALEGYPEGPLYTDSRLLEPCETIPSFLPVMQKAEEILSSLEKMAGLPYIWGGNWSRGNPELLKLYPPAAPLDPLEEKRWTLAGVDCSGMLYEATHGLTPRNTSQLLAFGKEVPAGSQLRPLDLIIWKGHVVIVFDETRTIESACSAGGVVFRDLHERLVEIRRERGRDFSIRRWIPPSLQRSCPQ